MIIRKIKKTDLRECARILKNEYKEKPYKESFLDGNEIKYIESKFKNSSKTCFVIQDENKVIGFCFASISFWADGLQGIIEEIVIDGRYKGKGLGKKIYSHTEKYLKNLGAKSLMLWVNKDADAHKFHTNNGFQESDEHVVMFKNI